MILLSRKLYQRLHFYLGNVYRFLTIIKFQRKISASEVRTIFGASFGEDGWHHIIKTLEEYDAEPDIEYDKTSLYRFLKHFTPKSICDVTDKKLGCDVLPLFNYPWGTFKRNEQISLKDPMTSRFCGPSEDEFIRDEFERTISLYKKIKTSGYRPWTYGNSFIGGTFLINNEGQTRFVVLQGNHRMAILAHLKYQSIDVREVRGYLTKVLEKDSDNWLLVKSGKCSVHVAHAVFSLYFRENGKHIKKLLEN